MHASQTTRQFIRPGVTQWRSGDLAADPLRQEAITRYAASNGHRWMAANASLSDSLARAVS
jgi:hypothetical protein